MFRLKISSQIGVMSAPGCALLLLLLLQCGSSLPMSQSHLEHEDVKVIKCIVEVLADILSTPQSLPVSQQCLETLRTDDRLVSVLRHRNFLQELQDIAVEGPNERPEIGIEERSDHAHDLQDPADQSMLMAVLTPGETLQEGGAEEEQEGEEESQENDIITHPTKGIRVVMRKAGSSEEEEEDEADQDGAAGALEHKQVEKKKQEELHEQVKGSVEKKAADVGAQKPSGRRREPDQRQAFSQQAAPPHHSKEAWPSPEEEELQMMAGRNPKEGRDPEEGSGTKKNEDAEMESLAVMENELENMAQKLHGLRHG
ncbi:chromogranin-A isoform X1 [Silurus meridionalis]|uniref:chromogranin-A isoform X1 n=1 Tax=Silurus meridionalis TaxID=175797 RepID=UPI001EEACA06|nr:chromogranin-A isoform X1 [Silurus meridionalis]